MPNNVVHFAVHADDLPRARRFYEAVFGWRFEPWGPPDEREQLEDGSEVCTYHAGLRWAGAVLFFWIPLPLMIPVGWEHVSFTIRDGRIVSARSVVMKDGFSLVFVFLFPLAGNFDWEQGFQNHFKP